MGFFFWLDRVRVESSIFPATYKKGLLDCQKLKKYFMEAPGIQKRPTRLPEIKKKLMETPGIQKRPTRLPEIKKVLDGDAWYSKKAY
jgi:hypothetical protein